MQKSILWSRIARPLWNGGGVAWLGFFFLGLGVLSAGAETRAPVRVVATTTQVADLVRAVGGDAVELTALMGPGVDPHLYKPTRRDVTAIQRAEVIFYNGLHLEGRMTDILEMQAARGRPVFALTDGVARERLLEVADEGGVLDPHIWLDPLLWRETVSVVVSALRAADPGRGELFVERGAAVVAELTALDAWARERIAQVPEAQRVLITSHDAYSYFGRAYGFQVIGVQGISTVSEAGLADVVQIVEFIRTRGVKAVFVESSVSPRLIERISTDSGAVLGGELFSDSMGKPGDVREVGGESYDVGTYFGMVKHNVNQIVEALR